MDYVDLMSDLEEGEIPDDSPSSTPQVTVKKDLPRRYILRENKCTHKHKKNCKYAIRYHAKKLTNLKRTPVRVSSSKKHRKSCPRDKSNKKRYNDPLSDHFIKNGLSLSKHSLMSDINCSFKDLLLKKQKSNPNTSNPQINPPETKIKLPSDKINSSESNKNNELEVKITNCVLRDPVEQECYAEKLPHSVKELDHSNKMADVMIVSRDTSNANSDESEDEEELRRIALATCAKRHLPPQTHENNSRIVDSSLSVPESSIAGAQIVANDKTSNLVSDNYEVVDMEVDDESSVESLNNECLFIIDTKPSSETNENVQNSAYEVQHIDPNSDDDLEVDILRAELIGSMIKKRALLEEQLEEPKPNNVIEYPKHPSNVPKRKISLTYQKPKVILRPKPLQAAKRILGKNGSVKLKGNNKLTRNNQINKSPKRLIISLNGESSSEESDDAREVNTAPENPVASIEALISDCRQKSNSEEKSNKVINHVPKALSCLSKAQQEEYNALLKILAEKKKLPASHQGFKQHNTGSVHSPLDDIKFLEGKLSKFKETLEKKTLLMTNISKDVGNKRQLYMKSKLSAQHLKEKYVAAEKVRRKNLDEWSKSCKNFEVVKKSVSSLESKILQLQNLCSKLGSSVQGLTCSSSLPINNNHHL